MRTHQKHIPLCRNRLVPYCALPGDWTDVIEDPEDWAEQVTCHRCKTRLKRLGIEKLLETREFMARKFDIEDERSATASEGCCPKPPNFMQKGEIPQ